MLFVPPGQKPISEEYPSILIAPEKQKRFEYLVGRLALAQKQTRMPTLGQALDHAEDIFLDSFEASSIAKIKQTFGI